jgi:hypothetical protein
MHMESTFGGTAFMPHNHTTTGGDGADETRIDGNRGVGIEPEETNQLQARIAAMMAENQQLRAELERIRSERAKMSEVQSRLMEVLGSKSPDRLVHDVRNVMNERELYRALADSVM